MSEREGAEAGGARSVASQTIMVLGLSTFASAANLRVCDALLPDVASAYGSSIGDAGAVVTAFAIGYGLCQIVFGPLGDRIGKLKVIAWTVIATGLATALCATAPSLDGLTALRLAAGAFAGGAIPLAFAWIGDTVDYADRQPVLARFISGNFMGMIAGQVGGGLLAQSLGWRATFVALGCVHLIAGLVLLRQIRGRIEQRSASVGLAAALREAAVSMAGFLRRPWPRTMLIAVALEAFLMYGAFAFVGADLRQRFGLGPGAAGLLVALFGAGALLYSALAPKLVARLGQTGLVLWGGVVVAISYLVLAVAPELVTAGLAMVGIGLGFYMLHNTLQTNATQMAPEARGLAVSQFALWLFVGQSIGVALASGVMDAYGGRPIETAAGLGLFALAIWFRSALAAHQAAQSAAVSEPASPAARS